MTNQEILKLNGTLWALFAFVHLVRFFWDIPMSIGTWVFPGWTGALIFIPASLLAAWTFKALYSYPSSNTPSSP